MSWRCGGASGDSGVGILGIQKSRIAAMRSVEVRDRYTTLFGSNSLSFPSYQNRLGQKINGWSLESVVEV